jgi:hypothetical protein
MSDITRVQNHPIGPAGQSELLRNDILCDRCTAIDFRQLFDSDLKSLRKQVARMEIVLDLGVLDKESQCAVCRLFYSAQRKVFRGGHGCESRDDLNSWAVLFPAWDFFDKRALHDMRSPIALGMAVLTSNKPKHNVLDGLGTYRGPVVLPVGVSATFGVPRGMVESARIDSERVNYRRIQDWLRRCQDEHTGTCCRLPHESCPVQIACIDCDTREIVPMGPNTEYLALSYVWGARNTLPETGSITTLPGDDKVPKVVQDAIVTVPGVYCN